MKGLYVGFYSRTEKVHISYVDGKSYKCGRHLCVRKSVRHCVDSPFAAIAAFFAFCQMLLPALHICALKFLPSFVCKS